MKSLFSKVEKLDEAEGGKVLDARPENAFTAIEYAEHLGLRLSATRDRIRRMAKEKKIRRVRFHENSRVVIGWELI